MEERAGGPHRAASRPQARKAVVAGAARQVLDEGARGVPAGARAHDDGLHEDRRDAGRGRGAFSGEAQGDERQLARAGRYGRGVGANAPHPLGGHALEAGAGVARDDAPRHAHDRARAGEGAHLRRGRAGGRDEHPGDLPEVGLDVRHGGAALDHAGQLLLRGDDDVGVAGGVDRADVGGDDDRRARLAEGGRRRGHARARDGARLHDEGAGGGGSEAGGRGADGCGGGERGGEQGGGEPHGSPSL